jgi:hypothetical protein
MKLLTKALIKQLPTIEAIKLSFGMGIERDRGFSKTPLSEVMETIKSGGHI